MKLGKKVNLIFIPHEQSLPRHFRLPFWAMGLLSILALALLAGIVYIIVSYTMIAIDMSRLDKVREDVDIAERKIEVMNSALTKLEDEAKSLDYQRQTLLSMHTYENERLLDKEDKSLAKDAWTLEDLDLLIGRSDKLTDDLGIIDDNLKNKASLKDNLPTKLPTEGRLLTDYGNITYPITGKVQYHYGIDLVAERGMPIFAAGGGTITKSEFEEGYGLVVELSHGNGIITRYCHNLRNVAAAGDKVRRGDLIAYMGYTGNTTGTHLHYEVKVRGRYVDPKDFILEDIYNIEGKKIN